MVRDVMSLHAEHVACSRKDPGDILVREHVTKERDRVLHLSKNRAHQKARCEKTSLQSFEKPVALVADQVTPFTIDLHSNDHRFLKGHRIMVQVQSSWFPIIDRNPQTFMPSIFDAKERDFTPATQKVYRTTKWPSNVTVTVADPGK